MKKLLVPLLGWVVAISGTRAATIIAPSDDPLVTAQMYRDEAALYPSVGKVTGSGLSGSGVLISLDGIRYLAGISSYTGRFGPGAASSYGSISGCDESEPFPRSDS